MAKRKEREFRKVCREAARQGKIADADGKWIDERQAQALGAGAAFRDTMGGYKLGEFARKNR